MYVGVLDNVRDVDILFFIWLDHTFFIHLLGCLFDSEFEGLTSDSFVHCQGLAEHEILVGETATDIVDDPRTTGIQMCILISILLKNLPGRIIQLPNIDPSKAKLPLQELTNLHIQEFLLILM